MKLKTNGKTKLALIEDFDKVLSIGLASAAAKIREAKRAEEAKDAAPEYDMSDPLVAETVDLIEKRRQAKKDKNFAEADRIRDYLASKGVTLIDTPKGTTFKIG